MHSAEKGMDSLDDSYSLTVALSCVSHHCGSRFDELPQDCFVVLCCRVHVRVCFQANPFWSVVFWCHFCFSTPMSGWACHWKPFWIPVGDSWKKALMEEWVSVMSIYMNRPLLTILSSRAPITVTASQGQPGSLNNVTPREQPHFWERLEASLPPLRSRPKCDFVHPQQLSPFPERLELPFFER